MSGVEFTPDTPEGPVAIDIYDRDLVLVDRVLSTEPVNLEKGDYIAFGRTPDGRESRTLFAAGTAGTQVRIGLDPEVPRRAYVDVAPNTAFGRRLATVVRAVRGLDEPTITEYRRRESSWAAGSREPARKFVAGAPTWDALVLEQEGAQPVCLRVPAEAQPFVMVKLRWLDRSQAAIDVRLANDHADALIRYFDMGDVGATQTLLKSPALHGEELLQGKRQDPVAAAAGAYVLLRSADVERLHNWTTNLKDWFGWLPDAHVIYAEHMARLGKHDEAAAALRGLPGVGLPLFSMGLGMAIDRLGMYGRAWPHDVELATSLEELTRYALATDFSQPITTFSCTAPDAPAQPAPPPRAAIPRRVARRLLPVESSDPEGRTVFRWRIQVPTKSAVLTPSLRSAAMTDRTRFVFAIIVTAVFIIAAVYLVSNADTRNQQEWERLVYVFGAIEAIAFAAVGWVFGAEVNRKRADSAEKRAEEEQQKKDEEVEKGRTLAGMVVGAAEGGGGGGGGGRERLESHGQGGGATGRAAVEYAKRAYGLDG